MFTEVSKPKFNLNDDSSDIDLITSDDYDEEENQAKLETFCYKFKSVQKEFCKTCIGNKMMLVCMIGACISRLYTILFSTFWLLFIASFIGS